MSIEELSLVLKKMKHNKTPGIDGFTSEFFKVFWARLKYFVPNAINECYNKGVLSTTLRQSLIICLPKGNKDRRLLKKLASHLTSVCSIQVYVRGYCQQIEKKHSII